MYRLAASSCRQAVLLRNPEFAQRRDELPGGFEGLPGDFWKISINLA